MKFLSICLSALCLASGQVLAQPTNTVLVDTRFFGVPAPPPPPPPWSSFDPGPLEVAFPDGAPEGARVGDDASGSFTRAGTRQIAVIVHPGGVPNAAQPFEHEAGILVVYDHESGKPVSTIALPDAPYREIRAAADIDDDGLDELFLAMSAMNMGEFTVSLDIVALEKNAARVERRLSDVYVSLCGKPTGEQAVYASVITYEEGNVASHRYRTECGREMVEDFEPLDE